MMTALVVVLAVVVSVVWFARRSARARTEGGPATVTTSARRNGLGSRPRPDRGGL